MGAVLVTLKVMPEGPESDLESISDELKGLGIGRFNSLEKEPIAFGLVALKAAYVVDDAGGVADSLEERIRGINGVRDAEVVDATLV